MAKLHEILAAEKTPMAAWNQLAEETLKKFGNVDTYFHGQSRSLKMIEDSAANTAIEQSAREEKPVPTTVYDTLEYALEIFGRAEDLQYQKNATNREAVGTVMFDDKPLLIDMPVDELLGLEARLGKIRQIVAAVPTLDASKHWSPAPDLGAHVWELTDAEKTTKGEKTVVPFILAPATKEHPANVQPLQKDVVIGTFSTMKRSGAATTAQKADAIKNIDKLLVEVKQARMRANETKVTAGKVSPALIRVLLSPFA